ncbi:hypothetical protein AK812_SmicGene35168 [Symbiodinium microadriaticum]|uniref:Uncharacterized protein n=1 Tax=Symbiodinium microadriaticum TaxID=2951 RepID=A0A1Q9CM37_SYMMI|nr:hypothetical protein AK812_SmicGene35168 [Symbiodinium microadriaticum]
MWDWRNKQVDATGAPSPAGSREAPQVAESQPAKVSFDPAEVTSRKGTRKEDLQDRPPDEEEEADKAQQMAHGDKAVSFEAGSQIQESEDQARRVSAEALELDFCFVRVVILHAGDVQHEQEEEEEEAYTVVASELREISQYTLP